jgi:hypothetical protein
MNRVERHPQMTERHPQMTVLSISFFLFIQLMMCCQREVLR